MANDRSSGGLGKWTRRGLIGAGIVAGGALIVGVAIRPGHRAPRLRSLVADEQEALLNVWLKIAPDNRVTAIVPHAEMGQGTHSTLAQMLADEMDARWDLVDVAEAPAHEEYANYALGKGFLLGDADVPKALVGTVDGAFLKLSQAMDLQITGGSTSVRTTGLHAMRVAGAAARQMLAEAAANTWQVSVGELVLKDSRVSHAASGREAAYAELAAEAATIAPPAKPKLKSAEEFRLIGKSAPRLDIPAKVDGSAAFGIDASVPGMKVATVMASPVFGGSVQAIDDERTLATEGVLKVLNLGDFVAVIAEGYWPARQGLAALNVQWAAAQQDVSQESIFAQFANDLAQAEIEGGGETDHAQGDVDAAIETSSRRLEAEYRAPYLAHAAMEPLNCTIWLRDGRCDVWTGTQNPLGNRAVVAEILDLDVANVAVHNAYLGGGFGRRFYDDYVRQAARVAKAMPGTPVKLIWSREEDIRQDRYRPAVISRFRGGLDADRQAVAWSNLYVNKEEPGEAPQVPYAIPNQHIRHVTSPTHVPFGVWRSVDHSQHGFFTESFIDEMAVAAGADPYQFRRSLLTHASKHRDVLDAAAEAANWGSPTAPNQGRGIALQRSFGTTVAQVVDLLVDATGKVSVRRVTCAVDAGFAVNPGGLIAQMESAIVYGLSAALYGEIQIENGSVKQSNFHDYPVLRIDEMPEIETVIINGGGPLGGGGEPGTPPLAPALANAVYDAIGVRVRELPLAKHDLATLSLVPQRPFPPTSAASSSA